MDREQVEYPGTFTFLGIVVMDNQLKPTTKSIIQELNQGHFRNIIATGDNIFTSICVAKKCHILKQNCPVIHATGTEFDSNYESIITWQLEHFIEKEVSTPKVNKNIEPVIDLEADECQNLLTPSTEEHSEGCDFEQAAKAIQDTFLNSS